ncbi:MAG: hypothetical protein CL823_07320 [Crocinitomicaceae bacterium]|nr:hypothetical protein [Crocinitomicaceae bacterium]
MNRFSLAIALILGALQFAGLNAQVVINEFSCSNYTLNVGGDNEDFIEFYNAGAADVDLGGYFLSDQPSNPNKFEIPAGTNVPAGGHIMIICSGEGELITNLYVGGNLNTNFKINQCQGESIIFSDPSGAILEQYDFLTDVTTTQADHSWARTTDGGGTWAICLNPTANGSNNGSALVSAYAPTPEFDIEAGYYAGGLDVAIMVPAGYEIRYTTNGYAPNGGSTIYTGPISVNTTTVIRAIAIDPSGNEGDSFIATNTYFTGDDSHTITVVSCSGDEQEDGSWPGGWGGGADEPMHIEFFTAEGTFIVEASGDSNEHGNDSNAYGQRGFDYVTRDQMGYDYALEEELFHVKNRDEFQRLIFKAGANDNYPYEPGAHIRDAYVHTLSHIADLKLDERTSESCIVYLNGEYWGVYEYREKVDDTDFTREYYDQPRHFVDFLKTWGGTWEEYGDGDDWYDFVDFVTGNDMTVQANYDYAITQLHPLSLIDYFILNSYIVSMDWLNWNTAWWRGRHPDGNAKRWRYALWDCDASFGHYINYTGIPDTGPTADPCNPESMGNIGGQGHIPVLNALMDNEDFFALYVNRWADLGNTHFTCESMHSVLDSMVLVIEPEMARQCDRWGGSVAGWQSELQQLRDFIDTRCEDELLSGMEDCYDVTPFMLTLEIVGMGDVEINSVDITPPQSPFSGWYFEELAVNLTAEENYGVEFLYWEIVSGTAVLADSENPEWTLNLQDDLTIRAHFGEPVPPEDITFSVEPAEAGSILLDGILIPSYPSTESLAVSGHIIQAIPADQWWVFSHWTTSQSANIISPDTSSPDATLDVEVSGQVTAHFTYIEHLELEVEVQPAGAGAVTVVNTAYVDDYWQGEFLVTSPLVFKSSANEQYEFDRWIVEVTEPMPNDRSTEMSLDLEDVSYERVIAQFKEVDFRIFIPNAFTPDNDGVNDSFLPLGQGYSAVEYEFLVLNRWGEIVFKSNDPNEPWVGQNNQITGDYFVPDGVYMYSVTALGYHSLSPETYRGSVTIVR